MKIYIDNGHGQFTPGKRSPDDSLREAFYNREIAKRVVSDLKDRGHDAILLVPEDDDISLKERVSQRSGNQSLKFQKDGISQSTGSME